MLYYRPQTKFAKVMFSQVPVCPLGGDLCPGGVDRGGLCPNEGSLSKGEALFRGGVSVPVRLRAGGTHPTGMHSC